MKFKIPYYVGPLNASDKGNQNSWIIRKSLEKIYPWNFEKVVDLEASAEKFITRMTSECTYLQGEDVLPKQSLLYSQYMVLNELNNVRLNGEKLEPQLKQKIYKNLFQHKNMVTIKQLKEFLKTEGVAPGITEISGIDGNFKANLKSYIDMTRIFADTTENRAMFEELVRWIVIFGNDKKILKNRIAEKYALNEEQMKKVLNLRYSGWGRLSVNFLNGIQEVNRLTGELGQTIVDALWNTNNNLMQLLGRDFGFMERVQAHNDRFAGDSDIGYQMVKDLYVSPAVKRQIWQALKIVDELKGIMKHAPKRIFIEMARGEEEKKRTISRRSRLLDLYKACNEEQRDWIAEISSRDESDFRKGSLYLYYTQMGRCMYTGKPIDLANLFDEKNRIYDIDHIFPQSVVKDDSLSNKVLVTKKANADKSDAYPLSVEIRKSMKPFWHTLKDKGLIEKSKYDRLVRNMPFSDAEKADFIARQLVETRQSTKIVAELMTRIFPESKVVYVKAGNVSDFRHKYELFKVREVNDYHHAKDAFLNIVVGNAYYTKFTENPLNFVKAAEARSYSLKRMFDFDITRGEQKAWKTGYSGTIGSVKKTLLKNNINFTRQSYEEKGQLFDVTLKKKGKGQMQIKKGMDIAKYGGYNKVFGSYYILVEHDEKKGGRQRKLIDVPIHFRNRLQSNKDYLAYCESQGLVNPVIRYSKIKMKSLVEVNGFRMHLTGRTGDSLVFANAQQLIIGHEWEQYLKKIGKFSERFSQYSRSHKGETLTVTPFDGLDKENNVKLFDEFVNKANNTIYAKKLVKQGQDLSIRREEFIKLSLEKQSLLLLEILKLFQCNRILSNFTDLGLGKSAGMITTMATLKDKDDFYLINQSPTGIFEEKINLSKI